MEGSTVKEKVQQRGSLIPPAVCVNTVEPGKSLQHNFVCLLLLFPQLTDWSLYTFT